ncbi:DUF3237 family protein [Amycolatopsis acidicola]|nr:DUF3237 family protein [Amycolatopsis acidicola]
MTHPALALELVARLEVTIGEPIDGGDTPAGRRRVIPITGGTVAGPLLRGEVLALGADWSLLRGDGVPSVTAKYLIRTHDGVVLTVTNTGTITVGPGGASGLTTPKIEAPAGEYAWLNDAVLVGTLVPLAGGGGVSLEFHRVQAG